MSILSQGYKPTAKAALFHDSPAYETLWGGVKGTGKTAAVYADPVVNYLYQEQQEYERTGVRSTAWFMIFRREYPRLKELMSEATLFYKFADPAASWNGQDHTMVFSSGMKVEFAHLEHDKTHENYNGRNLWGLYFDEAEEVPHHQYVFLRAMVRSTEERHPAEKWRIKLSANPAGEHVDWLEEYFVGKPPKPRQDYQFIPTTSELPDGTPWITQRVFIPAEVGDNPYQSPQYYANLRGLPSHLQDAYLRGIWGVSATSYFGGIFKPEIHVVRPFAIPPNWNKFRSGDAGFKDAFPIHWHAVDQNGNVYTYRELTLEQHTARMAAHRIREIEMEAGEWYAPQDESDWGQSKLHGVLSPDAFIAGRQVVGVSSAQLMNQLGCRWTPANNERVPGWQQMADYLVERKWFIFTNCERLRDTLPKLQSDDKKPEDIGSHQHSHWAESCRYALQSRPRLGHKAEDKMSDLEWSEEQYKRLQLKRQRNNVTGY